MKLTRADLELAREYAFRKAWPTLPSKLVVSKYAATFKPKPFAGIHAAVNAHGGLSGFGTASRKYHTSWHNLLVFIGPRGTHKNDWRDYRVWQHSTSYDYLTCVGRLSRKLRKAELRSNNGGKLSGR